MATYKHRTIARYSLTDGINPPFQFDNFMLVVLDEERNRHFLNMLSQQSASTQNEIVEINEEAMATLERRPGSVIRGMQDTGRIPAAGKGAEAPRILNEHLPASVVDNQFSPGGGLGDLTQEERDMIEANRAAQAQKIADAAEAAKVKAAADARETQNREDEQNKPDGGAENSDESTGKPAPSGGMSDLLAKATGKRPGV